MATFKALDSPDLYTVGWIAALPIERAAATAMLDERHDKPCGFVQHRSDTNSYTWGKISEHNIVIASLPAGLYGTTSAATTASNLLSSFPQIRIGLLVGIGGGIARPEQGRDIRLGDIVVSQPQGTTGGVIQYDLGKAKPNQNWERKGFLSMPPQVLLQALASLQAKHELGESRIPEFLRTMPQKGARMANSSQGGDAYVHQGFENDRLFKSSYGHVSGLNCRNCNATEEVERVKRDSTEPEIHYGIIASGNTLVKEAATRDKIVEDVAEECICLEMEAAGLMNHFPCLVIRGICDYADSHKNDQWQRYASATAAAYGKELLGYVPTRDLKETQRALDVLRSTTLFDFPLQTTIELSQHSDEVWDCQFSHDGRKLATASRDCSVIIYDTSTFDVLQKFMEHSEGVSRICWSPNDFKLLTCSLDKKARVWSIKTGQCLLTMNHHRQPVTAAVWAPDGKSFVTASMDLSSPLCHWSIQGQAIHMWAGGHRFQDVAITPDGRRLVAADVEGKLHVYNFDTHEEEYSLALSSKPTSVTVSSDSQHMLVNLSGGLIQLLDIETTEIVHRFRGHKQEHFVIRSIFGGTAENLVVSGSEDSSIYIWNRENSSLVETLDGHITGCVSAVSWNPTHPGMFASAGDDGLVRIWIRNGDARQTLLGAC